MKDGKIVIIIVALSLIFHIYMIENSYGTEDETIFTLQPPLNVTCDSGVTFCKLSWLPPSISSNYTNYRFKIYRNGIEYVNVSSENYSFYDVNVEKGESFFYYVTAYNETFESNRSNEVTGLPIGKPDPPLNLKAHYENGTVYLTWENPKNDGGMQIIDYRIHKLIGFVLGNTFMSNTTSYIDKNAQNGYSYLYGVSARNDVGDSIDTTITIKIPGRMKTKNPRNLTYSFAYPGVILYWEEPENVVDDGSVTKYEIWRGTSPYEYSIAGETRNTSFHDLNVESGFTYYYQVKPYWGYNYGKYSETIQIEIPEDENDHQKDHSILDSNPIIIFFSVYTIVLLILIAISIILISKRISER